VGKPAESPGRRKRDTQRKKVAARRRWTAAEKEILRRLYRTRSNAYIAQLLGRSASAVTFQGHRLGLSKGIRRLKHMGRENVRKRWRRRRSE
jgi:hypothetical protein